MPDADVNFGSKLFELRSAKRLTQFDIASRAELGRGYYSQLENSKKGPPSPGVLQRIVQALDLSETEARKLLSAAVAERCALACHSTSASAPVAMLVKTLVQSAPRISDAKAARIEAILEEEE
jgi:transcriptional regulator with XRE-family HTH domain